MRWLDLWIVPHVAVWAVVGAWFAWLFHGALTLPWLLALVAYGSIAWEAVESAREIALGHPPELWQNRLIVDPISNTLGALVGWWVAGKVFGL